LGDNPMTIADLSALLPLIVVAITIIAVVFIVAFRCRHLTAAVAALIGHGMALATLPVAASVIPHPVMSLLVLDGYGLFYLGLLFTASGVVSMLAYGYLRGRDGNCEAFYVLQLLATLGAAVLVVSSHLVSFFLGLELLSVALYALIAYLHDDPRPVEAGVKYLMLAAASGAFLLFGMALIYAELGTMAFARLAPLFSAGVGFRSPVVLMGLAMIVTGMGFKLAIVPFHMWTPDVYEGAPAPVTAFIATVSKGAMIALLLRYFIQVDASSYGVFEQVFSLIAAASMLVGNLLALLQNNIKRLLAYSSIAHLGYLLVAFVAGGTTAAETATFYLLTYVVTVLGAFGVVIVRSGQAGEADAIDDYRGLFWRQPGLALVFSAALLSLAGLPLTAGFLGKFYVLVAGVESARWLLVALLVLSSAIGLFYYLRIVVTMYAPIDSSVTLSISPSAPSASWVGGVTLTALTLLLLWLGIYPTPFLSMIRTAVVSLT
jgi:NADH-quinone oxidoreductase subunit N